MKNLELVVYGSLRRRLAPRLLHLETIATRSGFLTARHALSCLGLNVLSPQDCQGNVRSNLQSSLLTAAACVIFLCVTEISLQNA